MRARRRDREALVLGGARRGPAQHGQRLVDLADGLPGGSPRADYVQNRWAAARFGASANLIHPDGRSLPTATELAVELLERVRPEAERLGGADVLSRIEPSRCEADLQLEQLDPRVVAAGLVRRSLA